MVTAQSPIGSGFGAATTAAEVLRGVDLSGRLAIVTGGYSGVGLATTQALIAARARVVVPARDEAKARARLYALPTVEIDELDLMDPGSIDRFAARRLARDRGWTFWSTPPGSGILR